MQQEVISKEFSKRLISAFKDLYNKTSEEEFFLKKKEHQSIIESILPSETLKNIRSFTLTTCVIYCFMVTSAKSDYTSNPQKYE